MENIDFYKIEDRNHALEMLLELIFKYDLEDTMLEAMEAHRKELIPKGTPEFGAAFGDQLWMCHALANLRSQNDEIE